MKKKQTWEDEKEYTPDKEKSSHRYKRRRKTKEGYPVPEHKFTYDEIKAYQSTDRIICLLCGNDFGSLAKHLVYVHDITVKEYKDMYGLPNKRGLSSPTARQHQATAVIIRNAKDKEQGKRTTFNDPELREEVRKKGVVAAQHQKHQPFRSELSKKHLAMRKKTNATQE